MGKTWSSTHRTLFNLKRNDVQAHATTQTALEGTVLSEKASRRRMHSALLWNTENREIRGTGSRAAVPREQERGDGGRLLNGNRGPTGGMKLLEIHGGDGCTAL